MSKKVMVLCSSPRKKGNTNTVARWVMEGVAEAGGEADSVNVAKLKYKVNGCISCYGCQKSDKYECVVEDEAQPILKRISDYEVLVFATPIYFFGPNAQMKLFMDRMFCLAKFDAETGEPRFKNQGQKVGLIATAGGDLSSGLELTEQLFKAMAVFTNVEYSSLLVPSAPHDPKELLENAKLKKEAYEFGRSLVGN
jgi:multimeric flavodoxin WrbA